MAIDRAPEDLFWAALQSLLDLGLTRFNQISIMIHGDISTSKRADF